MSTERATLTQPAHAHPTRRFIARAHWLTPAFLQETWTLMNRRGAPGVDGETPRALSAEIGERSQRLVERLKAHPYVAPPVRRVEIPKGEGKTRPLGIPTVEDRLVQRAVARLIEAVFEADVLDGSYGFRPGRSAHDALRQLRHHIVADKTRWVFEADIRGYFTHIQHDWLLKMLDHRIGDGTLRRLVAKWLRAGVMDHGVVRQTDEGTPQGGPISPVLANIYLHYVLDVWFDRRVRPGCQGEAHLVRFADDFVVTFQDSRDAQRFAVALRARLAQFGLELAEEKTRLLPFGRFAHERGTPGTRLPTFDFLGFTHVSGQTGDHRFTLVRIPTRKSLRKFLDRVHTWLVGHRHWRRRDQQAHLRAMLTGFYQYFGLHHCRRKLWWVYFEVQRQWRTQLRRRSQRHWMFWSYLQTRDWFRLPPPALTHPTV